MMSRIPKWKIEKTKVKVVFRLQFHATQIPQTGWDKLFVSFIPVDIGKVTSKTSKVSVRNGNCKWSDPIYETTRLLQDPKTKDYDEKLYKLVVAMGSSKSSILGDVIINLADFADALKPSSIALPLLGCEFGTILHVTVQLLTSKTGFREFEQQRELIVKGSQGSGTSHESTEVMRATSGAREQMDKENLLEEEAERGTLLDNNAIQIAKIEKHFREQQRLMSGMELFHKQLNRLRSENLSFDINFEEYQINADLHTLQRELLLLDVANEKLGIIFPSYRTLNGYGNTLERVLSLEVELAEALQVKKKPESHFQSSFLKQYNDDEAIFQSFRDINELIKDMLELKKRNAAVESELQDMQDRYSQLSLKFAEVEGERQKLVMSLKNRRQKKS